MPSEAAIIEVNSDSIWILGGRERLTEGEIATKLPPSYKHTHSAIIYTLSLRYLSEDFQVSPIRLPKPLAYHCAVFLPKRNSIFIHGGATNTSKRSPDTFLLDLDALSSGWENIGYKGNGDDNYCQMSDDFDYTNSMCESHEDRYIVVPTVIRNKQGTLPAGFNEFGFNESTRFNESALDHKYFFIS